jgi:hypothetical protein
MYFLEQKILCAVVGNETRMCKAAARNMCNIKPCCTFYDITDMNMASTYCVSKSCANKEMLYMFSHSSKFRAHLFYELGRQES